MWGDACVGQHLYALAVSFGLGEVVQTRVALELEGDTVGQSKRNGIPQLQHACSVGGHHCVVGRSGVHAK